MTDIAERRTNDNPYLAGNMAPVEQEVTAFDLSVTGEIPTEFEGRW
jgi:carotenoid cleavage dioxygenase-like enzyme